MEVEEIKDNLHREMNHLYQFKDEITDVPTHMFGDHISNQKDFLMSIDRINRLINQL
jgi:hypothetical protein